MLLLGMQQKRIFVRILVLRLRDIYTLMVLAYNNFFFGFLVQP